MPETYGTRPLSWYAEQTPDDEEEDDDREREDDSDDRLQERRGN